MAAYQTFSGLASPYVTSSNRILKTATPTTGSIGAYPYQAKTVLKTNQVPITAGYSRVISSPAVKQPMLGRLAASDEHPAFSPSVESPWGGGCPWQCEKTEFKKFCKGAINDPNGRERKELYGFLAECFLDADGDRDGKISELEFDFLVEKAASLPRRFGLAPSWTEAYGDLQHRMQARHEMFLAMNVDHTGTIGLSEWVRFAIAHIAEKVRTMDDVMDFQHLENRGQDEMVDYCEVAITNSHSEHYKSLYEHLFKTFVESDVEENGAIRREQFDILIEDAAKAPRAVGLAPSTSETYASEAQKVAARDQMFRAMDTDSTGFITFEKFLKWSLEHIAGKVKGYKLKQSPWGGGCPWQCDKTEFKQFCKSSIEDPQGSDRKELYGFLAECFLDADGDRDGKISEQEFDFLVEKAASLPRRFGLAPSWPEAYVYVQHRMQARHEMFLAMNVDHTGKIGLSEWVRFAIAHIAEKVRTMDDVMDFQHLENRGQEEMVRYCEVAVSDIHSEHYKSLYEHLFKTFVESDVEENGAIGREQFDILIEDAAKAPRVVGLAPSTSETYASEAQKVAARDQMFRAMDTDSTGLITFEKFLNWSLQHIAGKVDTYKTGVGYTGASLAPKVAPKFLSAVKAGARTIQSDDHTPWGGGCPWQCEKTEFKRFCKSSIENPRSSERKEMYGFLAECFLDADGDRDGKISEQEFDFLVEKAAALPRRFGLAPSWPEAYGDVQHRMQARHEMFLAMNVDHSGKIGLSEWVRFAIAHIAEKVRTMDQVLDFQHLEKRGQEEMVRYCEVAVTNMQSEHYKSLYEHLFKTFVESDVEENGAIRRDQFDILIEDAAKAPRVVGLAPSTSETYASEAQKVAARDQMFRAMDTDSTGLITFEKFLNWSLQHIAGKVDTYKTGVGYTGASLAPKVAPKFLSAVKAGARTTQSDDHTPWGGGCPWQCEKTEFKRFCKSSIENPRSSERKEMYGFLAECFLDADGDRDGKISEQEFDFLVEKAAALPRRFGLAPSWPEAYGDVQHRMQARHEMFLAMNVDHSGKIGLSEWVRFAIAHIAEKVRTMDQVLDFQHLEKRGQEEMVRYCEVAVTNMQSEHYKSLYEHLFKTFVESDVEENGAIRRDQFDILIEDAAKAPRVVGLAPSTSETYASEAQKVAARDQMFRAMDTDSTGLITFEKFLNWSLQHIAGKVSTYKSGQGYRRQPVVRQVLSQPISAQSVARPVTYVQSAVTSPVSVTQVPMRTAPVKITKARVL